MQDQNTSSTRLKASNYPIFFGENALEDFFAIFPCDKRKVLVLTDRNTEKYCLPLFKEQFTYTFHLSIDAGDEAKHLGNCEIVWNFLSETHFSRHDLLINLGGGMICDLGGFAASCYKRGIDFVHIPTTLLAMADAAVGGKTGVNLQGFKNQIGAFANPAAVVLDGRFLATLAERELRSGFAEVLKHTLIAEPLQWQTFQSLIELPSNWTGIIENAVSTKLHFTENDPFEKGMRKALNFGHTIGHALESYFLKENDAILHGEAVAAGIWCEAWLSLQKGSISEREFASISKTISNFFPILSFEISEIAAIAIWALQDKKNLMHEIRCVLLNGIGAFLTDQIISLSEIENALRAYLANYPSK